MMDEVHKQLPKQAGKVVDGKALQSTMSPMQMAEIAKKKREISFLI